MYIDDATLKQRVADVLKRGAASGLAEYWDRIVPRANRAAYDEIVGALASRGYSSATIQSWDRGAEFQEMLGLFWCGQYGAAHFQNDEGDLFREWDRREELRTVPVLVAGELQSPSVGGGPIGYGAMKTGKEVFRPLRRDTRTGQLTTEATS